MNFSGTIDLLRNDYSPTMLYVPDKRINKSYIFKVMCEGGLAGQRVFSNVFENVVIQKDGHAPDSYKDICQVKQFKTHHNTIRLKNLFIFYVQKVHSYITTWMDQEWLFLRVENNTLENYPFEHERKEGYSYIAFPAEHVNSFLQSHDIVPTYIDANFAYGYYDESTGNWTGMMGHVRRN